LFQDQHKMLLSKGLFLLLSDSLGVSPNTGPLGCVAVKRFTRNSAIDGDGDESSYVGREQDANVGIDADVFLEVAAQGIQSSETVDKVVEKYGNNIRSRFQDSAVAAKVNSPAEKVEWSLNMMTYSPGFACTENGNTELDDVYPKTLAPRGDPQFPRCKNFIGKYLAEALVQHNLDFLNVVAWRHNLDDILIGNMWMTSDENNKRRNLNLLAKYSFLSASSIECLPNDRERINKPWTEPLGKEATKIVYSSGPEHLHLVFDKQKWKLESHTVICADLSSNSDSRPGYVAQFLYTGSDAPKHPLNGRRVFVVGAHFSHDENLNDALEIRKTLDKARFDPAPMESEGDVLFFMGDTAREKISNQRIFDQIFKDNYRSNLPPKIREQILRTSITTADGRDKSIATNTDGYVTTDLAVREMFYQWRTMEEGKCKEEADRASDSYRRDYIDTGLATPYRHIEIRSTFDPFFNEFQQATCCTDLHEFLPVAFDRIATNLETITTGQTGMTIEIDPDGLFRNTRRATDYHEHPLHATQISTKFQLRYAEFDSEDHAEVPDQNDYSWGNQMHKPVLAKLTFYQESDKAAKKRLVTSLLNARLEAIVNKKTEIETLEERVSQQLLSLSTNLGLKKNSVGQEATSAPNPAENLKGESLAQLEKAIEALNKFINVQDTTTNNVQDTTTNNVQDTKTKNVSYKKMKDMLGLFKDIEAKWMDELTPKHKKLSTQADREDIVNPSKRNGQDAIRYTFLADTLISIDQLKKAVDKWEELVKDGFVKREVELTPGEKFEFIKTRDFESFDTERVRSLFSLDSQAVATENVAAIPPEEAIKQLEKVWGDKGGDSKVTMQLPLAPPPVAWQDVEQTLQSTQQQS